MIDARALAKAVDAAKLLERQAKAMARLTRDLPWPIQVQAIEIIEKLDLLRIYLDEALLAVADAKGAR